MVNNAESHDFLKTLKKSDDGIYGVAELSTKQLIETEMRKKVAKATLVDPMQLIPNHHSIPVMDNEIQRFLDNIPKGGIVLDLGGCWGWHWRNLNIIRPDVKVVIVELVRENLIQAASLLQKQIAKSVFLVHGDATALEFENNIFDGVWTVQTFQHIPDFEIAVKEAFRVLKPGGNFVNYSLNNQFPIRLLYNIFNKSYVVEDWVDNMFWLARASEKQKNCIEEIFKNKVLQRYSEVIYSPELYISSPGRENSFLGKIDQKLSNNFGFFGWFARQLSYHCQKI